MGPCVEVLSENANTWACGLGLVVSSGAVRPLLMPVSDTEDMRLWPWGRGAKDPVMGVNEARLDDAGAVLKEGMPARDMSIVIGAVLWRRFSVWRRMRPRLGSS